MKKIIMFFTIAIAMIFALSSCNKVEYSHDELMLHIEELQKTKFKFTNDYAAFTYKDTQGTSQFIRQSNDFYYYILEDETKEFTYKDNVLTIETEKEEDPLHVEWIEIDYESFLEEYFKLSLDLDAKKQSKISATAEDNFIFFTLNYEDDIECSITLPTMKSEVKLRKLRLQLRVEDLKKPKNTFISLVGYDIDGAVTQLEIF